MVDDDCWAYQFISNIKNTTTTTTVSCTKGWQTLHNGQVKYKNNRLMLLSFNVTSSCLHQANKFVLVNILITEPTNKSVSSLGCTYLAKASLWVWVVKLHVLLHVLFIQLQIIKNVWYTLARWNYSLRVRNQSPFPSYTMQYSVKSINSHWTGEDEHKTANLG